QPRPRRPQPQPQEQPSRRRSNSSTILMIVPKALLTSAAKVARQSPQTEPAAPPPQTLLLANDSSLLANPFASAPYRSANYIINRLIENIFGEHVTLQSLPPEELLFGTSSGARSNLSEIDARTLFGPGSEVGPREEVELVEEGPVREL